MTCFPVGSKNAAITPFGFFCKLLKQIDINHVDFVVTKSQKAKAIEELPTMSNKPSILSLYYD